MERIEHPPRLAARPEDAHKGSVGRVLVVGGSRELSGAPGLAGLGALRAGAGLVRVAVPAGIQPTVAARLAELTTSALAETAGGGLAGAAVAEALALVPASDAAVVGPGAGRDDTSLTALRQLVLEIALPLVVDADALFALIGHLDLLRARRAPTVLTPHEGEAARLLETSSKDVRGDRDEAARALQARSGGVVVLKGPRTVVVDGDRKYVNATGGPVLAAGGTGDVLSGILGAFLAGLPGTGDDPFGAACAAVWIHGLAGEAAANGRDRGVLASEVADAVPHVIASAVGTSS